MLLAIRHKRTQPALAPCSKAGTQLTYPGGKEGWVHWVDLGNLIGALAGSRTRNRFDRNSDAVTAACDRSCMSDSQWTSFADILINSTRDHS